MVVKFVASKKTCTHCAPKNRSNSIWIMVIVNLDFVHLIPRLVLLLPKFDLRACDSQIKNVGKTRRTIAFWCVMINRPTNCGTIASSGPQVSVRLALICRWARTTNNWFRGTIWSLQFYWPNGCLKGFRSCCWFHVMIIFRGNQCAYSGILLRSAVTDQHWFQQELPDAQWDVAPEVHLAKISYIHGGKSRQKYSF